MPIAAQGIGGVTFTPPDANGNSTVSVDMSAATGGSVTVTKADGTTETLSPGDPMATYDLPGDARVRVTSSTGEYFEFWVDGNKTKWLRGTGGGTSDPGPELVLSEPPA